MMYTHKLVVEVHQKADLFLLRKEEKMILKIPEREGKGFEVQFYNTKGDAEKVYRVDTAEELAQFLARSCWSCKRFDQNPTVWKDGKKWCFGEDTPVKDPKEPWTNREYLIKSLSDPNWMDDGGASYDSMLYYHIDCPYPYGDPRAHCSGKPDDYICWDNCNACKEDWLDREVDE